jgi:hypothetical protein
VFHKSSDQAWGLCEYPIHRLTLTVSLVSCVMIVLWVCCSIGSSWLLKLRKSSLLNAWRTKRPTPYLVSHGWLQEKPLLGVRTCPIPIEHVDVLFETRTDWWNCPFIWGRDSWLTHLVREESHLSCNHGWLSNVSIFVVWRGRRLESGFLMGNRSHLASTRNLKARIFVWGIWIWIDMRLCGVWMLHFVYEWF